MTAVPSFIVTDQTAVVLIDAKDVTTTRGIEIAAPPADHVDRWATRLEKASASDQACELATMVMKKPMLAALVRIELVRRKQKAMARDRKAKMRKLSKELEEKRHRTSIASASSDSSSTRAPSSAPAASPASCGTCDFCMLHTSPATSPAPSTPAASSASRRVGVLRDIDFEMVPVRRSLGLIEMVPVRRSLPEHIEPKESDLDLEADAEDDAEDGMEVDDFRVEEEPRPVCLIA